MCVAIFKPAGVQIPGRETLHKCWVANPHGAGIAIRDGERVVIEKGFMCREELVNLLLHMKRQGLCGEMLLHFRLATSGLMDGGNTHPFPLHWDEKKLRGISQRTDCAIVHNGIFNGMDFGNVLSDTGNAVKMMAMAGTKPRHLANKIKSMPFFGWSKVAVMRKGGVDITPGWVEKDGCFFSNLRWI